MFSVLRTKVSADGSDVVVCFGEVVAVLTKLVNHRAMVDHQASFAVLEVQGVAVRTNLQMTEEHLNRTPHVVSGTEVESARSLLVDNCLSS